MDKIIYLSYPIMLLVLLIGSKWSKKGEWNEEFMTLKQTKYLQGYFALCIMMHHIGQETCADYQNYKLIPGLEFFVPLGFMFTAVFFMCSGYGLYKSYKNKNDYLRGFIRRRILPLVIAFYVTGWIFFIARIVMKEKMTGWKIFCYVTGWGLPNLYSWFMIALAYFYLVYYVCFRFLPKEWMKIGGTVLGVFLWTLLGTILNHPSQYWMRGEWWYNCVHLFWIGMIFAKNEGRIVGRMKKHYALKLILLWIGTFVFFNISRICEGVFSYYGEYNPTLSQTMVVLFRWICLISQMLATTIFIFAILVLNLKLRIGNRLLGLMGTITMEFYLIHGLFLEFFSYKFCEIVPSITRIMNVPLLIVIVLALSIPSALMIKKFDGLIYNLLTGKRS